MADENDSKDSEREAAFSQQMNAHVYGGFVSLGLAIGSQCGLFDKMIEVNEPMTPQTLAEKTGCKTRYGPQGIYIKRSYLPI